MNEIDINQRNNKNEEKEHLKIRNMISVLIPVYNGEKYIAECLDSVLCQTYSNIEVIVMDDASTDDSFEILKLYAEKDSRVKVFRHEKNKGLSYSRYDAFKASEGEWIAFMDHDDFIAPWGLEKMLKACQEDGVEISCIGGSAVPDEQFKAHCRKISQNDVVDNKIIASGVEADSRYFKCDKELGDISGPWGKIFKRDLFEKVVDITLDFMEEIPWTFFEDALINSFAIIKAEKVEYLYIQGYAHRMSDNSLSSKKEPSVWHIECLKAIDILMDYYKDNELIGPYNIRIEDLLALAQSVYYRIKKYGMNNKETNLIYIDSLYHKYMKDYLKSDRRGVKIIPIILFYKVKPLWSLIVGNLYFRKRY